MPTRLVLLGVAIAAHAVLAQLIYAGILVDVPVPEEQRRVGGDLVYYGGDIAELLLAWPSSLPGDPPAGRHPHRHHIR